MAELAGDLVAEAAGAEGRDRQAAGGDHQRLADDLAGAGGQPVAIVAALDLLDGGIQADLGAGFAALDQQQLEDVAGLAVAEQLAELLLVVGHVVLAH
ncbi:hypothetical protein D3C75_736500 [compost metagenome]